MRELLILAIHLLVTFAKLARPGGVRAVAAESLLLKRQLVISNRSRRRAPNLTSIDRFVLGLTALFVSPPRIAKLGALVKPATLFKFHQALISRKYRLLFSHGFARIYCDACGHDYLLAYSCKTRYFCPSCHQKRVLLYCEWVRNNVLEPVAHRQAAEWPANAVIPLIYHPVPDIA